MGVRSEESRGKWWRDGNIFVSLPPEMAIQVTYRRTRRLSMRIVKNGDVHVSVPYGMPRAEVDAFLDGNRDWIVEARRKTLEREGQRSAFFNRLPLQTREQMADARRRLEVLTAPMVAHHAREMNVMPAQVSYRAMVSRWGVCYIKRRSICLSLYLLLLPEWCVESTVVHELCHLLEPSHNARFYALMDRYYPRWREARRETKRLCSAGGTS